MNREYLWKYWSSILQTWHQKWTSQKKENDTHSVIAMETIISSYGWFCLIAQPPSGHNNLKLHSLFWNERAIKKHDWWQHTHLFILSYGEDQVQWSVLPYFCKNILYKDINIPVQRTDWLTTRTSPLTAAIQCTFIVFTNKTILGRLQASSGKLQCQKKKSNK